MIDGLAGMLQKLLLDALVEIQLALGENVLAFFVEDEHAGWCLVRPGIGVHLKLGIAIGPALGDELIDLAADIFQSALVRIGECPFVGTAHEQHSAWISIQYRIGQWSGHRIAQAVRLEESVQEWAVLEFRLSPDVGCPHGLVAEDRLPGKPILAMKIAAVDLEHRLGHARRLNDLHTSSRKR